MSPFWSILMPVLSHPLNWLVTAVLCATVQVEVVVDTAAAAQLVRVAAPWTVTTCDWEAGGPK
jgi:hypothetical protein